MDSTTELPALDLDDLERFVRARFARDGKLLVWVPQQHSSQGRQLRRLRARLLADDRLQVGLFIGNGRRYMTVTRQGELVTAWAGWPTD
jgi:hypothetical protein